METWNEAPPQATGAIERRLSERSFTTSDPYATIDWLKRLDWQEIPTYHRTEVGRLELGGVTACVFASGLVILILTGGAA